MNKLQSGPPRHGQILMADCGLFLPQQLQFDWLRWSCRNWWHHTCPLFHTRQREILLLADSNHITWAPSIPRCLLSRPPVSRLGNSHTLRSERNQRSTQVFVTESLCADTSKGDTDILQRRVRGVEPFDFAASQKALFHMRPRGSLTGTVLTEGKALPEGSADLEI